jgi:hypothetical protein
VLNQYYDGTSDTGANGDVIDETLTWLTEDLSANTRPFVFVVGHEPAYILPDMTSGRVRHEGGGLEVNPGHRDLFWKLLKERNVTAYICGHTHNASAKRMAGIWQPDAGHVRGKGDKGRAPLSRSPLATATRGTSTTGPMPGASTTTSPFPVRW